MLATFMQAIDMTIANVSLPHMQGSLAGTQEQMSWVLTSYMIASAVMMPISAWLSTRFGGKRVITTCVLGFLFASMLCGISQNLEQIVFFRVLQGLSSAAIVPISQAIMLNINPPERHGRAMALWTMSVTLAPILGPVLGGWLTESHSWRWVFYVNVPVCLLCFVGISSFLPEMPRQRVPFDWTGFLSLSLTVFSLQLALDRGPVKGWLESPEICVEFALAALGAYLFTVHILTAREPLINLRIFKDRNFGVGCALLFFSSMPLYAPSFMLPTLLQGLMQYPVIAAGFLTSPRGIGMLFGAFSIGLLARFMDLRTIIIIGLAVATVGLFELSRFSLQMGQIPILYTSTIQGLGNGLSSVPVTTLMFATLAPHLRAEGAAVSGLVRQLGGAAGISLMQAFMVHNVREMQLRLAEHVTVYDSHVATDLTTQGLMVMQGRVLQQAQMLGYINTFTVMMFLTLACIPIVLAFRKARPAGTVTVVAD